MLLYRISFSFTIIGSLALGIFTYFKNKKSTSHKMWALTCAAVSLWAFFMLIQTTLPMPYNKALFFGRLTNISASFIPVFFTHFSLAIVGRKTLTNKLLLLGYALCIFTLFTGFSKYFVPFVAPWGNFYYYVRPGILYHLHTGAFMFFIIYSEYILFKGMKLATPAKRNQIKYMLISTSAAFLCGSTSFCPVYGIDIEPFLLHFVFLYTLIVSYAIVKHNLLDINIVIKKGLIYSILITVITSLYMIFALLIETLFRGILGYKSLPITILTISLLVIFLQPLKNKIQKLLDKYFFHGSIDQIDEENIKLREEIQKTEKLKAVATLAAGMAHEIKNPLTSIKTFTEFIDKKKDDPEFTSKFKKIVGGEVDRINNIVKQLLEFSKPSELQLKQTDINGLLDDTLHLLNNDLVKHTIKVEKQYATLPQANIDPHQMKQVFLNLFLNAKDAMKTGGTITVATEQESDNISIKISDTGIGIDKENLEHIFDPFFTKKDTGTGLGLSVVHGIIEKHGGKIEAKSILNKGTEFKILFPYNGV